MYHRTSNLRNSLIDSMKVFPRPAKVLVALSGGPDSRALFECLYELSKQENFDLGVAHVDHRWRKESENEASALKIHIEGLGVPFHLKTLDPSKFEGNIEEYCRMERMRFFVDLCREEGYGAVFLAHHSGDQAETILKRIFEGASLSALPGMRTHVEREGILFVRPWLKVSKEEILGFLDDFQIPYFKDATNEDPRFLRGKMRVSLLPYLEKEFGKKIAQPLERFGEKMAFLDDYLNSALEPHLKEVIHGPFGVWLLKGGVHPFLCEQILRKWFKAKLLPLSQAQVEEVVELYRSQKADKMVEVKGCTIALDRGRIFVIKSDKEINDWHLEIAEESAVEWKGLENVWRGKLLVNVPKGEYLIGTPEKLFTEREHVYFSKRWAEEGIPRFLREKAPVLKNQRGEIVEFFLQKHKPKDASFFTMNEQCGRISISVTWVSPSSQFKF